jgi:hypothetical protein
MPGEGKQPQAALCLVPGPWAIRQRQPHRSRPVRTLTDHVAALHELLVMPQRREN